MTMQTDIRLGAMEASQPVVMVDDDELDIEAASRGLKKTEIANSFVAFTDGAPFLQYLQSVVAGEAEFPAVVLLDINMPLMSGFDVLKQLRGIEQFSELPIVTMLTSSTHENDRKMALELGANDYLIKPHNYHDYTEFFSQLFGQ